MEENSPASTVDLSRSRTLPQTCAYTYMNKYMYITQRHTRRKENTHRDRNTHTHTWATGILHISSCHVDGSVVCCHGTLFLHVVLKYCPAVYSSNLQGLSSHFLEHRDVAMKSIIFYLSGNSFFFLHFSNDCWFQQNLVKILLFSAVCRCQSAAFQLLYLW